MFLDQATIHIRSGKGGNGSVHFRREKGVPKGGPDGGDGGRGGDVVLVGDAHVDSLVQFAYKPHWFAQDGEPGGEKGASGKAGVDCLVPLPLGTQLRDATTGEVVCDMVAEGQRWVAAPGGEGGLGNERFKTSTHQAPRESTPGGDAVERSLTAELRLIADVGLVGLPNAGKSTMLKAATRANAKIAAYPFTTLNPQLGIAELKDDRRLVLADLPGLIEGAAEGAGLGHEFLRHIERTRVLVHLIDCSGLDGSDPVESYATIRRELGAFSDTLARKAEIVVLSKTDLLPADDRAAAVKQLVGRLRKERAVRVMAMSAATSEGVAEVIEAAWKLVASRARESE